MNNNDLALEKSKNNHPNTEQIKKISQTNEMKLFSKILIKYKIMIIRHKISYYAAK